MMSRGRGLFLNSSQRPQKNSKTILALETSCDETAVAILRGSELLASEVASQIREHEKYGGVGSEGGSRTHLIYAAPLFELALAQEKMDIGGNESYSATPGPGR